jgi:hypothetical protein
LMRNVFSETMMLELLDSQPLPEYLFCNYFAGALGCLSGKHLSISRLRDVISLYSRRMR